MQHVKVMLSAVYAQRTAAWFRQAYTQQGCSVRDTLPCSAESALRLGATSGDKRGKATPQKRAQHARTRRACTQGRHRHDNRSQHFPSLHCCCKCFSQHNSLQVAGLAAGLIRGARRASALSGRSTLSRQSSSSNRLWPMSRSASGMLVSSPRSACAPARGGRARSGPGRASPRRTPRRP